MSIRILKEQLARLKRKIYPDGKPPCSECEEVRNPYGLSLEVIEAVDVAPPYRIDYDVTMASSDELELVLEAPWKEVTEDRACDACGREWTEVLYHLEDPSDELVVIMDRMRVPEARL